MRTKNVIAASVGLTLVVAALAIGWYFSHDEPPEYCQLSGRMIHPHMLTVVTIDGKRRYACCARCALTYQEQTRIRTKILSVTDYISGRSIDAQKAYFVNGSHIEPCAAPAVNREEGRTPYVRLFDRCLPSLLAFTSKKQAEDFTARNGGKVTTLEDLEKQINSSVRGGHQ